MQLKNNFISWTRKALSKTYCFLLKIKFKNVAHPDKEIYLSVDSISWFVEDLVFRKYSFPGLVFAGKFWSRKKTKEKILLDSDKYKGIYQHFIGKVPWYNTDLFLNRYALVLKKKGSVKGCSSLLELEQLYKAYDLMFQDIKKFGIRSSNVYKDIDPIYIYIDRDGSLIYTSNGNHRLYICIVLGVHSIPVKVWARHTGWQRKRDELKLIGKECFYSKYPHLHGHPDLED